MAKGTKKPTAKKAKAKRVKAKQRPPEPPPVDWQPPPALRKALQLPPGLQEALKDMALKDNEARERYQAKLPEITAARAWLKRAVHPEMYGRPAQSAAVQPAKIDTRAWFGEALKK